MERYSFRLLPRFLELRIWRKAREDGEDRSIGSGLANETVQVGEFLLSHRNVSLAADWAEEIDSQIRWILSSGRAVRLRIPRVRLDSVSRIEGSPTLEKIRSLRGTTGEVLRPLFLPEPTCADLYPYQQAGVSWLTAVGSGVLADEMGLGKTAQAINGARVLVWLGEIRRVMVVCPRPLIRVWEDELRKWAPELTHAVLLVPRHLRAEAWKLVRNRRHVLITSYEQIRDPPPSLCDWGGLLIADEAHRARNLTAQVTRGLARVRPKRFWALTGTPLERSPGDLNTMFSLIDSSRFSPSSSSSGSHSFLSRARVLSLRRTREQVLPDLPPVVDSVEPIYLSEPQSKRYRAVTKGILSRRNSGSEFLADLNKLRLICDYDPVTGVSSKIDRLGELIQEIIEKREKAIVFSYLIRPLVLLQQKLRSVYRSQPVGMITGRIDEAERTELLRVFAKDPTVQVLLLSSRVGGEGLTLTEANHVLFLNEWWNPSSNDQARDRVVRIGQDRTVFVRRLRTIGTIEEVLADILADKAHLMRSYVEGMPDSYSEFLLGMQERIRYRLSTLTAG